MKSCLRSEDLGLPRSSEVHTLDPHSLVVPECLRANGKRYITLRNHTNIFEAWLTVAQEIIVAAVHGSPWRAVFRLLSRNNKVFWKRSGIPPSKTATGIKAYIHTVPDPNQSLIINDKVVAAFAFDQFRSALRTNCTAVSQRDPSCVLGLVAWRIRGARRRTLHAEDLAGVVERQVLVVANQLDSELGSVINEGLVEFPCTGAARGKGHDCQGCSGHPQHHLY